MTTGTKHVGYAARRLEKFRYDNDPNEVTLKISKEAAADLAATAIAGPYSAALGEVVKALEALDIEPSPTPPPR